MLWRLILDGAATGARNMALDEALLLSHKLGDAPVLRFYDWNPPCLSLGRFQKWDASSSFIPHPSSLVRRPTGGRAIWHQHEITYCAVFREEILPPEARSVVGSYEWLSRGFITGLQSLGIEAQLAPGEAGAGRTANCFASAARSDFVVDGRKLIGAAQCRKNGSILQHGSLLLKIDAAEWQKTLGNTLEGMISLRELGITASRAEIVTALCRGIEQIQGATLQKSVITTDEAALVKHLEQEKYTRDDWNWHGKGG